MPGVFPDLKSFSASKHSSMVIEPSHKVLLSSVRGDMFSGLKNIDSLNFPGFTFFALQRDS